MRETIPSLIERGRALVLLALLAALVALPAGAQADAGQFQLIILHTNDLHGQVEPRPATWLRAPNPPLAGGISRIGGYVNKVRREAAAEGAGLLVLDAGDWTQGTPEGALEQGRGFLGALAHIGYDAMCVGNHEFDHGAAVLAKHLEAIGLPAVLANARDADGAPVESAPPYRILVRGGLRIAVVGLLSPDTKWISDASVREWSFPDPGRTLAALSEELAGEFDWLLPLTHLGLEGDRELARSRPGLELIVGGHSHNLLPEGVVEGTTRIVQAGSKAAAIGRVDVWFDADDRSVVQLEARIVDLFREPESDDRNEALETECRSMQEAVSEVVDVEVGTLAAPMTRAERPLASSAAGNLITDAMRSSTGADIALHNRGGIRTSLYTGVVTRRDVFDVLPFSNHLVTLRLSGRELESCLRRAVEGEGRRGPEFSGMVLDLRRAKGEVELVRIRVAGKPLRPDAVYELVTNSFLAAGGDGYADLARVRQREDHPALMRDVLEGVFAGGEAVSPPRENRYRFVD